MNEQYLLNYLKERVKKFLTKVGLVMVQVMAVFVLMHAINVTNPEGVPEKVRTLVAADPADAWHGNVSDHCDPKTGHWWLDISAVPPEGAHWKASPAEDGYFTSPSDPPIDWVVNFWWDKSHDKDKETGTIKNCIPESTPTLIPSPTPSKTSTPTITDTPLPSPTSSPTPSPSPTPSLTPTQMSPTKQVTKEPEKEYCFMVDVKTVIAIKEDGSTTIERYQVNSNFIRYNVIDLLRRFTWLKGKVLSQDIEEITGCGVYFSFLRNGESLPDIWWVSIDGEELRHVVKSSLSAENYVSSDIIGKLTFTEDGVLVNSDFWGRGITPIPGDLTGEYGQVSPDGSETVYRDGTAVRLAEKDSPNGYITLEAGETGGNLAWNPDGTSVYLTHTGKQAFVPYVFGTGQLDWDQALVADDAALDPRAAQEYHILLLDGELYCYILEDPDKEDKEECMLTDPDDGITYFQPDWWHRSVERPVVNTAPVANFKVQALSQLGVDAQSEEDQSDQEGSQGTEQSEGTGVSEGSQNIFPSVTADDFTSDFEGMKIFFPTSPDQPTILVATVQFSVQLGFGGPTVAAEETEEGLYKLTVEGEALLILLGANGWDDGRLRDTYPGILVEKIYGG